MVQDFNLPSPIAMRGLGSYIAVALRPSHEVANAALYGFVPMISHYRSQLHCKGRVAYSARSTLWIKQVDCVEEERKVVLWTGYLLLYIYE